MSMPRVDFAQRVYASALTATIRLIAATTIRAHAPRLPRSPPQPRGTQNHVRRDDRFLAGLIFALACCLLLLALVPCCLFALGIVPTTPVSVRVHESQNHWASRGNPVPGSSGMSISAEVTMQQRSWSSWYPRHQGWYHLRQLLQRMANEASSSPFCSFTSIPSLRAFFVDVSDVDDPDDAGVLSQTAHASDDESTESTGSLIEDDNVTIFFFASFILLLILLILLWRYCPVLD